MKESKGMLVMAVLTTAIGAGLLLNAMDLLPPIDWLWTIALCVTGILVLVFGGMNKLTVVIGPFLIFSSMTSTLRQVDILPIRYEIPLLVIVLGCLLLMSELLELPVPRYLRDDPEDGEESASIENSAERNDRNAES